MASEEINEQKKILEIINKFSLMDDTFFSYFMDDNLDSMEYILRIIMDKRDLIIKTIVPQKEIVNIYGRSVRFDVFATDGDGNEYNIEIQNANTGAVPQRARYNSGLLDYHFLQPSKNWQDLPETYVIFITANDVLKGNRPIYHIERYVRETKELFHDLAHIIYVNGENNDDTPLGQLMQDFKQNDPNKIRSKVLADRMKSIKMDIRGEGKMCKLMEDLMEEYAAKKVADAEVLAEARGEARGELRSTLNAIKNLMKNMNLSPELAMKTIGISPKDYNHYLTLL